jgi:(p)ppGpp synthase/HD superfamily hydrolase
MLHTSEIGGLHLDGDHICGDAADSVWLDLAVAIARKAHEGQVDKAGAPYITHPLRLSEKARSTPARIVAVLHDVVEDSSVTLQDLEQQGFSREIIEAVDCLTRRPDETYDEFIERLSHNPTAVEVKLLDLEDNMDTTRLRSINDADRQRLERYRNAHARLSSGRGHST